MQTMWEEIHDPRLWSNARGMLKGESAEERVRAHKKLKKGELPTIREAAREGWHRGKIKEAMNSLTLQAFVKEAQALQAGLETPHDYAATKAAVMRKFGMVKTASGGFMLADHLNEVAGLGTLAIPSLRKMRKKNQESPERMEKIEKSEPKYEAAGLGMLAAPYAHRLATKGIKPYASMSSRIGGFVSKHAPTIAKAFTEH